MPVSRSHWRRQAKPDQDRRAFQSFETEPFTAASRGQEHRAALRAGRRVSVKRQRPGVRRPVLEDMDVMSELASFVDEHSSVASRFGFVDMVECRKARLDGHLLARIVR